MGKGKKKDKRKRKHQYGQYSPIEHHKRVGKELIPPLNTMEQMTRSSWRDDHAPELLWAFLTAVVIPRAEYLNLFRSVATWAKVTFPPKEKKPEDAPATPPPAPSADLPDMGCEVDHTSISKFTDDQFKAFIGILTKHPLGYAALRPLLLLDALPGIERWRSTFGVEPTTDDWYTLADAVAHSFDHQSEKSTDIRWLKLIIKMIGGKMFFPRGMEERLQEVLSFPDKGDMRSVRPFIRAGEMGLRRQPPSKWIPAFWAQLMEQTGCLDGSTEQDYSKFGPVVLSLRTILDLRTAITRRFHAVKTPQRTDARLDATFGLTLYALSLLEEIAAPPIAQLILGRMGLRSMAEVVVTFAYLLKKDTTAMWETYRNYGTGVAKLAFLKLEQTIGDAPSFVDSDTLQEIANEDVWQEFVNVNLGHWANLNVRELAIEGGTKDIYDAYYDWTSTYSHGQWGAVRDSNFITCHNPLHRLHRIPRPLHRLLPSVVPDAVKLANRAIDLLEEAYTKMEKLPRIAVTSPKEPNAKRPPKEQAQSEEPASATAAPDDRSEGLREADIIH
jgi:hypothetical protein